MKETNKYVFPVWKSEYNWGRLMGRLMGRPYIASLWIGSLGAVCTKQCFESQSNALSAKALIEAWWGC